MDAHTEQGNFAPAIVFNLLYFALA